MNGIIAKDRARVLFSLIAACESLFLEGQRAEIVKKEQRLTSRPQPRALISCWIRQETDCISLL